ncbi:sporulation protein Cse60 [Bacillus dakarensis]|uniref:sporulation protein Cse60 n=1 Tax=Robertmurraya dakarensis TaxID=1926278 RepID=UPI0009819817|nr:sporulation protein Cse60 [Bacillus dakarensis]
MIQVKLFDQEHEKDLEKEVNRFLEKLEDKKLLDIKYNIAALPEEDDGEQIYCFSAMVIYRA